MLETLSTMPKEDLNSSEEDGLAFMREEEKLARDVYIAMYEKWDLIIFDNISKAEQKHMDALKMLLDRYSMEDPIKNDELGVFENEDLQTLYDGLIETGNKSLVDALVVGQSIEEIDILDLIKYTEEIDNEDITFVYDNLNRGSRNHLRAFVSNLNDQGEEDIEALYMTQEAFDEIINSDMEKGRNKGGRGKGNGRGKRRRGGRR
ncbi:MAG: DUF2202 domain-containing protein [Ignavibacteriae bacterium]|nr:DUF2202 domain-containing protein [Ignavibacteriota bacterium]